METIKHWPLSQERMCLANQNAQILLQEHSYKINNLPKAQTANLSVKQGQNLEVMVSTWNTG